MPLTVGTWLTFERPPVPAPPAETAEVGALEAHIRAGRCALFVGAGLSAPAGLPTWGALMDRLVAAATPWAVPAANFAEPFTMEDPVVDAIRGDPVAAIRAAVGARRFDGLCRTIQRQTARPLDVHLLASALDLIRDDTDDRVELQKLATQKRFAELAGACRDRLGDRAFHRFVQQALTPAGELPATHRDIVRTRYSCIVTTNFDSLLETAYARYGGHGVPRAPTGAELGQQGTLLLDRAFFILKAHGDAARPNTMVFTADDYRRVIHASPAFQAVLSGILLTHAVLFVGYSLSDTNFRLLLDNQLTVFNGEVPPRFAIMEDVGPAEADVLWRTARLRVLTYARGQHGEVGRCLAALADATALPGMGSRHRKATPAAVLSGATPTATLRIEGDGGRLWFALAKPRVDGSERGWVGGNASPDVAALGALLRRADASQGQWVSPLDAVRLVGRDLASGLPSELARALAVMPEGTPIELACSPEVGRLPWEWLHVRGGPLATRLAVMRRPPNITNEARGRRVVRSPLRALVVGDAGSADRGGNRYGKLEWADREASAIAYLVRRAAPGATVTRLSRAAATHARLARELEYGNYDVIHFAGHAWFDDREARFFLWDRVMLGSELAPLLSRRPPALMVLDTHYSAFVLAEIDADPRRRQARSGASTAAAAWSPRGFADAAMRAGITAFVGTFGDISDYSGATFSVQLFAHLAAGRTVAEALRQSRVETGAATHDMGLFYTAFGDADFRLVLPTRRGSVARAVAAARRHARWPRIEAPTR